MSLLGTRKGVKSKTRCKYDVDSSPRVISQVSMLMATFCMVAYLNINREGIVTWTQSANQHQPIELQNVIGMQQHYRDMRAPEGRFMEIVASVPHTNGLNGPSDGNWTLPKENIRPPPQFICPSFCGASMEFGAYSKSSLTGRVLERGVGTKSIFRVSRPDLLKPVRDAIHEIDQAGELDTDISCPVFGTCKKKQLDKSNRHSKPYLVCQEDDWIRANNILNGVAENQLPGYLWEQGDCNVFCGIAHYVADMVSEVIFPSMGTDNKKCIVQEMHANEQRTGAHTYSHVHPDDTYGGVFYTDVPKGTKLCVSNSEQTKHKRSWYKHAPNLTENLFPNGYPRKNNDFPAYIEPRAGDIVFFPVAWLNHWVPKMEMEDDEKRTSVVFNMICI